MDIGGAGVVINGISANGIQVKTDATNLGSPITAAGTYVYEFGGSAWALIT